MSKYGDEKVLVVSRALFDSIGTFQGVSTLHPTHYLERFLAPGVAFFMDRADAEADSGFKQIIPYVLFHCNGKWLRYTRGGSGGEARLHDKGSLGIGGHINPVDWRGAEQGMDTYLAGVERELAEEVTWSGPVKQRLFGLINDDSNEVGSVHLGVIHIFDVENENVVANEKALSSIGFYTLDELRSPQIFDGLETWSQLSVNALSNI